VNFRRLFVMPDLIRHPATLRRFSGLTAEKQTSLDSGSTHCRNDGPTLNPTELKNRHERGASACFALRSSPYDFSLSISGSLLIRKEFTFKKSLTGKGEYANYRIFEHTLQEERVM